MKNKDARYFVNILIPSKRDQIGIFNKNECAIFNSTFGNRI